MCEVLRTAEHVRKHPLMIAKMCTISGHSRSGFSPFGAPVFSHVWNSCASSTPSSCLSTSYKRRKCCSSVRASRKASSSSHNSRCNRSCPAADLAMKLDENALILVTSLVTRKLCPSNGHFRSPEKMVVSLHLKKSELTFIFLDNLYA